MEIRWSIPAAEDLERICERIERDNPEAARRELVFSPLSYIVIYQIRQETVEISRVFHSAQDWP